MCRSLLSAIIDSAGSLLGCQALSIKLFSTLITPSINNVASPVYHTVPMERCELVGSMIVRPSFIKCTILYYEQMAGSRGVNFAHICMFTRYVRQSEGIVRHSGLRLSPRYFKGCYPSLVLKHCSAFSPIAFVGVCPRVCVCACVCFPSM